MKKTYSKPEIRVVQLQQRSMLLGVSGRSLTNNVGFTYDDLGSSEEAKSRSDDFWSGWSGWDNWDDGE